MKIIYKSRAYFMIMHFGQVMLSSVNEKGKAL
jgi:hypothetical protein